jgi:hypothetical protein
MATPLTKLVYRSLSFGGRDWIVGLVPAIAERRFDSIVIRQKGKRRGGPNEYMVPVESFLLFAAERTRQVRVRERIKARKLKKFGQCV